MSTLARKLLRELWTMRRQYFALAAIVAVGVSAFISSFSLYSNLVTSYHHTYERLHFEDVRVDMADAPSSVTTRIAHIPGVRAVAGRLVKDIVVELPHRTLGEVDPLFKATARVITVPAAHHPSVDDLFIERGRYLRDPFAREVLVERSFALYHHLQPGQTIVLEKGSARVRVRIVGIVDSPEFIYVVSSKQTLLPNSASFGVFFVTPELLSSIVGERGEIDQIVATVDPGSNATVVGSRIADALAAYDPGTPTLRADQPSNKLLRLDLQGFEMLSVLFPMLFLGVAGIAVYSLIVRIVAAQRQTIGLLRALGYESRDVVIHYLGAASLIGLLGGAAGTALGPWLGMVGTRWYTSVLTVPFLVAASPLAAIAIGVGAGIAACVLGAVIPAKAAAALNAAQAMRPPTPVVTRVARLDLWLPGARRLPLFWRLPLRNLARNPRRTISTAFGVAAAISLLVLALGMQDSIVAAMDRFVASTRGYDLSVTFDDYESAGVVDAVRATHGVVWAEPVLDVPVDLRRRNRTESTALVGIAAWSRLWHLRASDGRRMRVGGPSVVVGGTLWTKLGLHPDAAFAAAIPAERESSRRVWRWLRAAPQPASLTLGDVGYADIGRLRRLFGSQLDLPPGAASGAIVKVLPGEMEPVRRRLLRMQEVGSIEDAATLRREINEITGMYQGFMGFMLVLGLGLGFAIVYNMATANVLERTTEAATMETLGIGLRAVAGALLLENLAAAAIGVVAGLPAGLLLLRLFIAASQSDAFSYAAVMRPASLAVAVSAVMALATIAPLPAFGVLARLDLGKATRERAL